MSVYRPYIMKYFTLLFPVLLTVLEVLVFEWVFGVVLVRPLVFERWEFFTLVSLFFIGLDSMLYTIRRLIAEGYGEIRRNYGFSIKSVISFVVLLFLPFCYLGWEYGVACVLVIGYVFISTRACLNVLVRKSIRS